MLCCLTRLTLNETVISDALSFETGLQFVVKRANVLRSDHTRPGGMAAIATSDSRIAQYISEMGQQDQVSIAVYNAADSNVVSGEMKALEKLMAAVNRDGIRATKLAVEQGMMFVFKVMSISFDGFHSHSIAPGLPALKEWLDEHVGSMKSLGKTFFSTVRPRNSDARASGSTVLGMDVWSAGFLSTDPPFPLG